ncbi:antitoxin Xre-like helix-turn-helix domain-containing protein [uncultured Limimaricola sp.]|uniref:antitoxin Xre-like helix-turn-helix domain-containing protein n=1 Tax=uncultured Limimaricola sp. TaxID=2211667 RepID=UPI0030F5BC75
MAQAAFADETGVRPLSDRDQVATLVRAVVRATASWGLSSAEAAALFDVPPATWARMKSGSFNGSLDRDKVTRASLILGIYKGLRLLFNGPLTGRWPGLPNKGAPYEGRRPLDMMIAGGIPAMAAVRQHIDALRGGL